MFHFWSGELRAGISVVAATVAFALPDLLVAEPASQQPSANPTYIASAQAATDSGDAELFAVEDIDSPFEGSTELSVDRLVEEVLERNPTIEEMTAAWQAAAARVPQAGALEDPMAGFLVGPDSMNSRDVDFAYRLEFSQKLPFPGKRTLRADGARWEAWAAERDIEDARLQLVESAKDGFYEYYFVDRAVDVNRQSVQILRDFRANAEAAYRTGTVTQQDLLQADVELGRQQERGFELDRMRRVAQGRLNALLHLPPEAPLPPPPNQLGDPADLPDPRLLQARAIANRPDIQARQNRIQAERTTVCLAFKEFKPDVELMAAYDAFWQVPEDELRTMIGFRTNLPVNRSRRWAAVNEARARVAVQRAALDRLIDQTRFQVWEAYEQAWESQRTMTLYRDSILRATDENVRVAQAEYLTGKIPFLALLEAQRNQVELRERFYEAQVRHFRRLATLERAVGGSLTGATPSHAASPRP